MTFEFDGVQIRYSFMLQTDQVESKVDDSEELVEYIKELHQQLKCKDDQIESIKEEIRCKKIWYKEEKKTLLHKVTYFSA